MGIEQELPMIAVVIPCYHVRSHVLGVIESIGPEVDLIFAIDDCCPEQSGQFITENCKDPRVKVIRHSANKGVGGAVVTGYRAALASGADIVVKIDGDGQMDPRLLPQFIAPLVNHEADYTKGNRFYSFHNVRQMPQLRLFGNAVLSFVTKMSSGYWKVFDPTNGYTAIHWSALSRLDLQHLAERYFFESDMLVKLGGIRAVVRDIPMEAVYGDEKSGLNIKKIAPEFLGRHFRAMVRRIVYSYFLRDFSLASMQLVFGILLFGFGTIFGMWKWWESIVSGHQTGTGTIMVSVLPVILGFQLLLGFFAFDINSEPTEPLSRLSPPRRHLSKPLTIAQRLHAD
jgi:dolichol-phosphate mannosyltransferase